MISEILMAIEAAFLFLLPLTLLTSNLRLIIIAALFSFQKFKNMCAICCLEHLLSNGSLSTYGKRRHYIIAKPDGLALSLTWLRMRHSQCWVVMHTRCTHDLSHHHSSLKEPLSCCGESFASK